MIAAARVLPLRPQRTQRGQRLPRRFPPTLRSIPTREASGAPAPAAPPPSSMGAPPAAPPASSAPPAAAPPQQPEVTPLARLAISLAAVVVAHKGAAVSGGALALLTVLERALALAERYLNNSDRFQLCDFASSMDRAGLALLPIHTTAAPPPPPVPESGERERVAIEPIVLLQGQLLAVVRSFSKPAELTGAAAAAWSALDVITRLISLHIVRPQHPLKFDTTERPEGALVSLFLDTREGGKEAQEDDEKRPAELPEELAFLAGQLAWALGDFAGAQESAQRIERALASTTGPNLRLITSEAAKLTACLNSLDDELRQIAGRIGGFDEGVSLATHAGRLARLSGYSDDVGERRCIVAEALGAWHE